VPRDVGGGFQRAHFRDRKDVHREAPKVS
jgi:hypothetical protein